MQDNDYTTVKILKTLKIRSKKFTGSLKEYRNLTHLLNQVLDTHLTDLEEKKK